MFTNVNTCCSFQLSLSTFPTFCLLLVGFPPIVNTTQFMSHVSQLHCILPFLPQKFTSVRVTLVIQSELQNPAEVEGKPTEGKNEDQAEHSFGHFSSLKRTTSFYKSTLWCSQHVCPPQTGYLIVFTKT